MRDDELKGRAVNQKLGTLRFFAFAADRTEFFMSELLPKKQKLYSFPMLRGFVY